MENPNLLILLIILPPLLGLIINGILGKRFDNKLVSAIAVLGVGIPFLAILTLFIQSLGEEQAITIQLFEWFKLSDFSVNIAYQIDSLSIIFGLVITGVGLLIHIYSIGYMHGDRSYYRFFAYMNLFIFMMLNLVLANNYILTFLGWEGVGLSSYLLIGFWYEKKFPGVGINSTSGAANKAFIVNRIGDFGFLVAIFFIYMTFQSFEYSAINETVAKHQNIYANSSIIFIICLMLFLACTGKSAQLPLAVWLPDAMAGPTSVSALIHAATMVTAGVYLIARNSLLFSLSTAASEIVLLFGVMTALFGAISALSQTDIKKVLAYSTVSQLGFMFAALGVGAYGVAVFHVVTHAFFKALLFLGSGSVIHAMHGQQDIKQMGGLKKYMPHTYRTFLIGTLAISGIPFFSGFFSKDEIMWNVFNHNHLIFYVLLLIAAFFTSFYMFRLLYLTFHGKERFDTKHIKPHESPKSITIPLQILAVLSAIGGFVGIPYALGFWFSDHPNLFENYLEPTFELLKAGHHSEVHAVEYLLMLLTIVLAVSAWFWARNKYSRYQKDIFVEKELKRNIFYKISWNKFYLDNIYNYFIINPLLSISDKVIYKFFDKKIFDGILHASAKSAEFLGNRIKKIQTGYIPHYLMFMTIGILIFLFILLMYVI